MLVIAALWVLALAVGALADGNGTALALRDGSGDVGVYSDIPPSLGEGAPSWRYCGKDGAFNSRGVDCSVSDPGYWKLDKEYLVILKAVNFNSDRGLAYTRIAAGRASRCSFYWFSGDVSHTKPKDCYFAEVDNKYIKSPVTAAGWAPRLYKHNEHVPLQAGLWAVKYFDSTDPSSYAIGYAGANGNTTSALSVCSYQLAGMAYGERGWDSFFAGPIGGATQGSCSVSVEPVIAAEHMTHFKHCAIYDRMCTLPDTPNGVIIRAGDPAIGWTYRQVYSASGISFLCRPEEIGSRYQTDGFRCEVFSPPVTVPDVFTNNVGSWRLLTSVQDDPSNPNPAPLEWTYMVGVETTRGYERSEEWGTAVTASVETEVEMYGVKGTVGLSVEQSRVVSQTISEEATFAEEVSNTCTCYLNPALGGEVAMWAWQVKGTENDLTVNGKTATHSITSRTYQCWPSSLYPPPCIPGYKCKEGVNCYSETFDPSTDCVRGSPPYSTKNLRAP